MMIMALICTLLNFLPHSSAASSKVALEVKTKLGTGHSPLVSRYILSQENGQFFCQSDKIPKHHVRVKELNSLRAPFVDQQSVDSCPRTVKWGNSRTCYDATTPRVVANLLRWCSEM